MLCVADALDALEWMESLGGGEAIQARANANAKVLQDWADRTGWVKNLVDAPEARSNTSVCLAIRDPGVTDLPEDDQRAFVKKMVTALEKEGAALDVNGYRDAPAGLRIWCGATVETADVESLTPWLDWAFGHARADLATTP